MELITRYCLLALNKTLHEHWSIVRMSQLDLCLDCNVVNTSVENFKCFLLFFYLVQELLPNGVV